MTTVLAEPVRSTASLRAAIERAARWIAPNWPLDRQIAVNPLWGQVDRPFEQVAAALRRLHGSAWTPSRADIARAVTQGEILPRHLDQAIAECDATIEPADARAALLRVEPAAHGLALLSDVIDTDPARRREPAWKDVITQQVSQHCASYFDAHQSDWHPGQAAGLFDSWRERLQYDHAVERLTHARALRARLLAIPSEPLAAIAHVIAQLGVAESEVEDLLAVTLVRINGWAAWCAYLRWEAALAGGADDRLTDLLAARLVWEALLDDGRRDSASVWAKWRAQWQHAAARSIEPDLSIDLVWQRAHEIAYQERLLARLERGAATRADAAIEVRSTTAQVVFCIDVRSERLRRALEAAAADVSTRGFAGFFGLPLRYTPLGTPTSRAQVPGLLAPIDDVTDTTGDEQRDRSIAQRRAAALVRRAAWVPFRRLPAGAFALVETLGMTYLGKILKGQWAASRPSIDDLGLTPADRSALHPDMRGAGGAATQARADRVEGVLRAMSLTRGFARLLVLVGHGSQSANNPHAAGLDCGACGGNTGEVNARVLARSLNDPSIRRVLRGRGIDLPDETVAVGALHNTTTDEVTFFDADLLPQSHRADLERLRRAFEAAGDVVRAERAPALGLQPLARDRSGLHQALRRRARDWAQTRPEWGLAGNAAFILAPRDRTRRADLEGRAFLHDYDSAADQDGKVLESLLAAPVVVAHWINIQYYASTVDPQRFGSGNKVLHNVVGGRIGVFEGNTGDLRIGLPIQSVHDGSRWLHAPLRLTVVVDAPRALIEAALQAQPTVRNLVANRWLYLWRYGEGGLERYAAGRWLALAPTVPQ